MVKKIVLLLFRATVFFAYQSYKIEGVNALLLIMPAKLIVPILRKYGATIGNEVIIHSPLLIHNAEEDYRNLVIGDQSYFGRGVFLDLKDKITIKNRVTVSMRVTIITHTDVGESRLKEILRPSCAPVLMQDDAYLGAGATILQGVCVGERAVVGAGSLVRHDIPPGVAVAGNPAREIKKIA